MNIKDKIYAIRGKQVMLDRDLAYLYGVEVKHLKRQVRRNLNRFPSNFMFQLSEPEFEEWRCQFVTSNSDRQGLRYRPYAFTEQGVSMLSVVLKSHKAVEISIKIMNTFILMRRAIYHDDLYTKKFQQVDQKLIEHDKNFEKIFNAIENKDIKPEKGIFFEGQIFDAHKFISDLINKAKNNIILIDNYIDYSTLSLFSNTNLSVTIYTKNITRKLKLDLEKYNS